MSELPPETSDLGSSKNAAGITQDWDAAFAGWLRWTRWRVAWLAGVIGFAWWTASIYHGHERLYYFSPQTLALEQQTRVVLLGTNIPILTLEREPDYSLPLVSDYLVEEEIWTPNDEPPKWYLIYHQHRPDKRQSWIFREFCRNQGVWVGWTVSKGRPWKVYRVFPEEFWAETLRVLRAAENPLDESLGEVLRKKRAGFPEKDVSGYQEASMSADYYKRLKSIRIKAQ